MTQKGPTVRHRFFIFCWTTDHEIGQCSLLFPISSPLLQSLCCGLTRHKTPQLSHLPSLSLQPFLLTAGEVMLASVLDWLTGDWTKVFFKGVANKCATSAEQKILSFSYASPVRCTQQPHLLPCIGTGLFMCMFVYLFTSTRWDPSNGSAGWPAGSPSPLVLLELQSATTQKHAPVMTMHSHKHHTALLCFWKQTNQKKIQQRRHTPHQDIRTLLIGWWSTFHVCLYWLFVWKMAGCYLNLLPILFVLDFAFFVS